MTIDYKIWDMPTFPVQSQLFYAGGQSFEGGFTSGGVRILSSEPGGRSFLELTLSLQVNEWSVPFSSWLMSKLNGDIFRVRLTATPQLVSNAALNINSDLSGIDWGSEGFYPNQDWDNLQGWDVDAEIPTLVTSLQGSQILTVDMTAFGAILAYGHAIGHVDSTYLIDDISYNGTIATITVNPPLREDVLIGDAILLRPFFLGTITNPTDVRQAYDRANMGAIQPGRLLMSEIIL